MSWMQEQTALLGDFFRGGFRRMAVLCAVGMLIAALLGAAMGLLLPDESAEVINIFMEQVEASGTVNEQGEMSVFALLMNNWRAMLVSAAYGFIPFLFLPLLSLLYNGLLLGMLAVQLQGRGVPLLTYLAGILPHGIFELPALALSVACGMALCRNICRMAVSSPKRVPLPALLEDLLRVLVLVVAPLTVAAAFVECYVTPLLIDLLL